MEKVREDLLIGGVQKGRRGQETHLGYTQEQGEVFESQNEKKGAGKCDIGRICGWAQDKRPAAENIHE